MEDHLHPSPRTNDSGQVDPYFPHRHSPPSATSLIMPASLDNHPPPPVRLAFPPPLSTTAQRFHTNPFVPPSQHHHVTPSSPAAPASFSAHPRQTRYSHILASSRPLTFGELSATLEESTAGEGQGFGVSEDFAALSPRGSLAEEAPNTFERTHGRPALSHEGARTFGGGASASRPVAGGEPGSSWTSFGGAYDAARQHPHSEAYYHHSPQHQQQYTHPASPQDAGGEYPFLFDQSPVLSPVDYATGGGADVSPISAYEEAQYTSPTTTSGGQPWFASPRTMANPYPTSQDSPSSLIFRRSASLQLDDSSQQQQSSSAPATFSELSLADPSGSFLPSSASASSLGRFPRFRASSTSRPIQRGFRPPAFQTSELGAAPPSPPMASTSLLSPMLERFPPLAHPQPSPMSIMSSPSPELELEHEALPTPPRQLGSPASPSLPFVAGPSSSSLIDLPPPISKKPRRPSGRKRAVSDSASSPGSGERPISPITGKPTKVIAKRGWPPKDAAKRTYFCEIPGCGKSFGRPSALSTHMRSHDGVKPFTCPIPACSRPFSVFSNLKRHMIVHPSVDFRHVNVGELAQIRWVEDPNDPGGEGGRLEWIDAPVVPLREGDDETRGVRHGHEEEEDDDGEMDDDDE
ncbi:hypothetical protein JCM1840_007272 [Sporobolomyces johnsonii]